MTKKLNIIIIGTGNVSSHLADSFLKTHQVNLLQAFNHKASKKTKAYAQRFHCEVVTDYKKIKANADIYIIAVKDDVISEVVKKLTPLKLQGLVVHTSGSVDVSVLKNVSKQTGVYYPLQTFYATASIDWPSTPILIEANSKSALTKLKSLAGLISKNVKTINSTERLRLHLAAVFACNFTNALYVTAFELIEKSLSKKDTSLLAPIMLQSFRKLESIHPKQAQTGPAMRHDNVVMKKHLNLLKSNKELTTVYKLLSQLIVSQQSK